MYLVQILQYLMWPLLILVTWFAVDLALSLYEKKFPGEKAGE